jgi:hypothetical protein
MLELFTNPGYLAAGGALVSSPIIIHLINRMRFRRVKWAAMEFLLKSQKRNRRRLIIEQLILLMLRCLLVILAALLVLRFIGFSFGGFSKQSAMHVILLDDSLSMRDHWQEGGDTRTAFDVAKKDIVLENIVRRIGQSSTADRVVIVPLSKLVAEPGYQPRVYARLNDKHSVDDITHDLDDMVCSKVHVPLIEAVKKAQKIRADDKDARCLVYLVSDFRSRDWKGAEAKELHDALVKLAKDGAKVSLIDTVYPYRQANDRRVPQSRDNVALVELRPETRVAAKGMPVIFTCTVANYTGVEQKVHIDVFDYDDRTGKEMLQELFFNPSLPLSVPANGTATVSFEVAFTPTLGENERYFAKVYAKLKNPNRNDLADGLLEDNVRHASVEIRNQVPVLVVDGEGDRGRAGGKDSFHVEQALRSVPGIGGYEVTQGEVRLLERPNLSDYASIYLLNVNRLNEKQEKALESYVQNGGGVAFFMGPLVSASYYNRNLYAKGKGLFPVPLADQYFPLDNAPERAADFSQEQILLRDEAFSNNFKFPIFGQVFRQKGDREVLRFLPIKRYWPVPRDLWQPTPGQTEELATLPNERPISAYADRAQQIAKELDNEAGNADNEKYATTLRRYRDKINTAVAPGSETRPYALAAILKDLLEDRGVEKEKGAGSMPDFWSVGGPKVRMLRADVERLKDEVLYGDPFVVIHRYGKGRTVAVMTTAGKDWNLWGGGSPAEITYVPFILEVQSYLSSQGGEANRMVGSAVTIEVDAKRFLPKGKTMKLARWFYNARPGKATEAVSDRDEFVKAVDGKLTLTFTGNLEPGFYGSYLVPTEGGKSSEKGDRTRAVASWGHVFNVDTANESDLSRVTQDEIDSALREAPAGAISPIRSPVGDFDEIANRPTDLSELAWFFLIFLLVLLAEQALAVHLSFHLRSATDEAPLPAQAVAPTASVT